MARNITVTFNDGTSHTYQNAPDDVTPDAVQARAEKEFGKSVTHLDGGRGAAPAETTTPPAQQFHGQRQLSFGEQVRGVAYPVMEAVGAGLGGIIGTGVGPAGTVGGAALGFGAVKGLENIIDQYTGAARPETLGQAAARTASDIATGATYEMGGQVLGKVAAPVVGKIVEKVTGKSPAKAATVEELKQAETQAWDKVANSTTTFKDPVPLKDSVDKLLADKKFNYDPATFSFLDAPLKELNTIYDSALKGVPADIHKMRTIRTLLQDIRMSGGAKAREKELAGRIMDSLDDYVIKQGGTDAAAWKEARDTSNQLFRSRDVQGIVKAAEESSRATSKEIRSQFKDILNSNQIKMYNPEQQAIIKQIADGSATEKTLEYVGIMAPKGLTWQKIAGLLGIGTYGGPTGAGAALAAYGTGAAARGTANALAKSRVNMLDELIRGGQMPQTIQLPQTTQRLFPAGVNVLANQLQGQQ